MAKSRVLRSVATLAALAGLCGSAFAQQQAQIMVERSLDGELPYTVFYPDVLQAVDDGSEATVVTLEHPDAPLRCDVFAVAGERQGWTAEGALGSLDVPGIEATWEPEFPGFRVVNQGLTAFAGGPALLYEGESEESPLGVPLRIIHAEAVDEGRTYAIECLVDRRVAEDARPLVEFLIANFSTRSDGECCTEPGDRG